MLIAGDGPDDEPEPPNWDEILATAFWRGVTAGTVGTVTLLLLALGIWTVSA